jgi:small subunit ribosomal protein S1
LAEKRIKGWLTESYDYERPRRGQVREGVIVDLDERGIIVDVGLKRDGFVPDADVERLGTTDVSELEPGQEIEARIVKLEDQDGHIVLSMYQARLRKDWAKAQKMLKSGKVSRGEVVDCNKGGLVVQFGGLHGFVPGSHLWAPGRRHASPDERKRLFEGYVGQELPLKVIEVNRDKRRLILSERLAQRKMRERQMERLLDELMEGEVIQGTVRRLCHFGAFVDLGGADGLIHISELSWQHVRHPREVVQAGDEIKVYVLRLDHERKRIALSLKRLRPYPWNLVEANYSEGELVLGTVTGIKDFGVFVALDVGMEGLVHISELADPPPENPGAILNPGEELVLRILRIDTVRHRVGLSLKQVSAAERERWLAQRALDQSAEQDEQEVPAASTPSSDNGKVSSGEIELVEEAKPHVSELVV